MKTKAMLFAAALVMFLTLTAPLHAAEQSKGTLLFDLKSYVSEVKLKEKVQKDLEHAGIEWGVTGDILVISFVNKKYVNTETPYMTRYGDKKTIELSPGQYKITCIGFIPEGSSMNVQKVLSKSAFFNDGILSFKVASGKTTTVEILPVFQKHSTLLVKMFLPELRTKVIEDGAVQGEAVINDRTSKSIPWDEYSGPLKF